MFNRGLPPVPFGVSEPYLKDNGQWYVTVTIDNASVVERLAELSELPAPPPVDEAEHARILAEIASLKAEASAPPKKAKDK